MLKLQTLGELMYTVIQSNCYYFNAGIYPGCGWTGPKVGQKNILLSKPADRFDHLWKLSTPFWFAR